MLESSTFWCSYLGLLICKLSTKIKYNIINLSCHSVHFIEQYIWRNLVDWTTTFHHFFRSELFFTPWATSPRRCSRRASPRSSTGLWPASRPDRKSTVKPKLWPRRRGWDREFSGKVLEVVLGDCIVVRKSKTEVKKIYLASIRPPRYREIGVWSLWQWRKISATQSLAILEKSSILY